MTFPPKSACDGGSYLYVGELLLCTRIFLGGQPTCLDWRAPGSGPGAPGPGPKGTARGSGVGAGGAFPSSRMCYRCGKVAFIKRQLCANPQCLQRDRNRAPPEKEARASCGRRPANSCRSKFWIHFPGWRPVEFRASGIKLWELDIANACMGKPEGGLPFNRRLVVRPPGSDAAERQKEQRPKEGAVDTWESVGLLGRRPSDGPRGSAPYSSTHPPSSHISLLDSLYPAPFPLPSLLRPPLFLWGLSASSNYITLPPFSPITCLPQPSLSTLPFRFPSPPPMPPG